MTVQLYLGDCLEIMKTLPDESVQCVVTSPPYYGLRDYGTASWEDGDPECDHKNAGSAQMGTMDSHSSEQPSRQNTTKPYRDVCGKCGAVRVDAQIGLEESPEEYVAKMVTVFREVQRVLREDGTLWLNLGDSYASGKGTCFNPGGGTDSLGQYRKAAGAHPLDRGNKSTLAQSGLKPKDLTGIPWRVAFALQAGGWWLRQDIIWAKPNPMPESVRDRCTKSHEYVFMLTKSGKYYYDAEAMAEPSAYGPDRAGRQGGYAEGTKGHNTDGNPNFRSSRLDRQHATRNRRDVWTISTHGFSGAHFATMPEKLAELCILAGSKPGDTVLDPFSGAGTTGLVAARLGRDAIGIDLNAEYNALAEERIAQMQPRLEGIQ